VALTGRLSQCQKALRLSEDMDSTSVEVLSREHRFRDRVPRAFNGGLVESVPIELYFPVFVWQTVIATGWSQPPNGTE
jgi:hypothetical protein